MRDVMTAPPATPVSRAQEVRTPLNAEIITAMVSAGETVADCCRALGCDRRDIYRWISDDDAFAQAMNEARDAGADAIAEKALEILDDQTEHPRSRQIRFDGRMRLLEKWHRKRYGQHVEVESTTRNANLTIPPDMSAEEAARVYQDWVRGAA